MVPKADDAKGEFAYRDRVLPLLDDMLKLAQTHHGIVGLFMAPCLDKPFREQIGERALFGPKWGSQKAAAQWADAHGVARVELAELLVNEDYRAIRMDPCCHYNAVGHEVLARVMLPRTLALLDVPGAG